MGPAVQTDRKLAAIMFTDIIPYSQMASKNEKNALSILKEHNSFLARSLIGEGKYADASEVLSKSDTLNKQFNTKIEYDYVAVWNEFTRTILYIKNKDMESFYLNINKLKKIDVNGFVVWLKYLTTYYLYFAISDFDKGFEWYNKYVEHTKHPSFEITSMYCKNAWKDDRYIKLLKDMKLYDYWKDSL